MKINENIGLNHIVKIIRDSSCDYGIKISKLKIKSVVKNHLKYYNNDILELFLFLGFKTIRINTTEELKNVKNTKSLFVIKDNKLILYKDIMEKIDMKSINLFMLLYNDKVECLKKCDLLFNDIVKNNKIIILLYSLLSFLIGFCLLFISIFLQNIIDEILPQKNFSLFDYYFNTYLIFFIGFILINIFLRVLEKKISTKYDEKIDSNFRNTIVYDEESYINSIIKFISDNLIYIIRVLRVLSLILLLNSIYKFQNVLTIYSILILIEICLIRYMQINEKSIIINELINIAILYKIYYFIRFSITIIVNGDLSLGFYMAFLINYFYMIYTLYELTENIGNVMKSSEEYCFISYIFMKKIKTNNTLDINMDQLHIYVNGLNFNYDRSNLFINLNLNIYPGEKILIIGANGTGKTTLANIIKGKIHPLAGQVIYKFYCDDMDYIANSIYILSEEDQRPKSSKKVIDYILGDMRVDRIDLDHICMILNIIHLLDVRYCDNNISHGERKKVQLAKVMLAQPSTIIFDNYLNTLDENNCSDIMNCLEEFLGIVIIMSTNDIRIKNHVDKLYYIERNCLVRR